MSIVQLIPDITWGDFLYYVLLLALIYLLIFLAPLPVRWLTRPGLTRRRWTGKVRKIRIAYEPIALVLGLIALIFVSPVLHGLIVTGLVVLGWGAIRNYIDGQLLRLTTPLRPGQEITLENEYGTVQEMNPLSLVLQTEAGSRIIPYRVLRDGGFTISRGARISGVHEFLLVPESDETKKPDFLRNHLFNCPYLSWAQQPDIRTVEGETQRFHVRLLLEDETYATSMRQLVREWGYTIEEKL